VKAPTGDEAKDYFDSILEKEVPIYV